MEWEDRQESENVEDRRGLSGGKIALGGGTILILLVGLLFGVDPQQLMNLIGPGQQQQPGQPGEQRQVNPQEEPQRHFAAVIFGDTERIWGELFQRMGKRYEKPTLVLYSGVVDSACGQADSAVGPFYCPGDSKVYLDLSFFDDMQRKLQAPGDFARAYVIAHEVGHHVQRLLGYSERVERARQSRNKVEANKMSVRLELQADYLAGVWAHHGQEKWHFVNRKDVDTALNAAYQIGDDRLQKQARGVVVPDSFTHGTSKQRQRWFMKGFETGDVDGARQLFSLEYEEL